jgi:hypothetical protein
MTSAQIIAQTFSTDVAYVRDCRYQPGHTISPIFTIGDDYYTVTTRGFPPKDREYSWERHADQFIANAANKTLWVAKAEVLP